MANDTTIQIIIEGENRSSPAFKEATKQADGFGKSIAKSIGVFAAAQVAGNLLSGVLDKLAQGLKSLTGGALQMAGKFQEMEFAALALGRAMGLTQDTIRNSINDLKEAGIRSDVAAKTTATLARNQIDLARSFDLARIAQATGILIGQDSSATMERLTQAVTVGNTRILRTMGIMVDFNKIVGEGAAALGKSVEALSQRELAEIRVQGVIDNSAAIMEVYGAAMESPTKALRSLTGRVIPEFQAALGQSFLPAWKTVISTISGAVKAFTSALQEGGALFPLMTTLGATASLAADGFKKLMDTLFPVKNIFEETAAATGGMDLALGELSKTASRAGNDFINKFINKLADAADAALKGGIEISAGLAEGLIRGAASALTSAMSFIGGLLSSWLSPGSPPKVAQDITKWGAGTFTEYLKGFTEADFSTLESLQKPINDVLSSLVDAGALGAEAASSTFKELTLDITKALTAFRETGEIDTSIFTKLVDVGGKYGQQLAALAKKQFEFAVASIAAEKAQEALANAMESQDKSQDKLNSIMEDFNRALREGASPEILNAKRQAFLEAKKQAEQAKKEVKLAASQNKEAKKKVGPLKKQIGLQEKLLKQLLEFTKVQKAPSGISGVGKIARGGVGEGMAGAIAGVMPTAADFDIGNPISDAIDNAKNLLAERFSDLFSPITDAWENVQPDLDLLKEQWTEFTNLFASVTEEKWPIIKETIIDAWQGIVNVWETVLKPALEGLWLFVKDNLLIVLLALIPPLWTLIIPGFLAWAAATLVAIGPILLLGIALIALGLLWKKHGKQVKETIFRIKFIVIFWLNKIATFIRKTFRRVVTTVSQLWFIIRFKIFEALTGISTDLNDIMTSTLESWESIWENFKRIIFAAINQIKSKIQQLLDKLTLIKDRFTSIWNNIKDNILPIFKTLSDFIELTLGPILKWFNETILTPLKQTFEFLSTAASNFAGWLKLILDRLAGIDPGGLILDINPNITSNILGSTPPSEVGERDGAVFDRTIIHFEQNITTSASDVVLPGFNEIMALTGA